MNTKQVDTKDITFKEDDISNNIFEIIKAGLALKFSIGLITMRTIENEFTFDETIFADGFPYFIGSRLKNNNRSYIVSNLFGTPIERQNMKLHEIKEAIIKSIYRSEITK